MRSLLMILAQCDRGGNVDVRTGPNSSPSHNWLEIGRTLYFNREE